MSVSGHLYWQGGAFYGNRDIWAFGGITISSNGTKAISQATMHSTNDTLWTGGNVLGSNGAQWLNAPSTTTFLINLNNPYTFAFASGTRPVFVNNATILSIGPACYAGFEFEMQNNPGSLIMVENGCFSLAGGGYNNGKGAVPLLLCGLFFFKEKVNSPVA